MKGKPKLRLYRRKAEGKTNYKQRLSLIASGKPRLVLRKTGKHVIAQVVEYHADGDKVLATATSKDLAKLGWKTHTLNIPAAYLTGLLCGVKAKAAKIKEAITDLGLNKSHKGGILYSALKGAIDSGLEVPHGEEALPSDERTSGQHITEYAKVLSKDKAKYEKQFSKYLKTGVKPEDISKQFETTKNNILKVK